MQVFYTYTHWQQREPTVERDMHFARRCTGKATSCSVFSSPSFQLTCRCSRIKWFCCAHAISVSVCTRAMNEENENQTVVLWRRDWNSFNEKIDAKIENDYPPSPSVRMAQSNLYLHYVHRSHTFRRVVGRSNTHLRQSKFKMICMQLFLNVRKIKLNASLRWK